MSSIPSSGQKCDRCGKVSAPSATKCASCGQPLAGIAQSYAQAVVNDPLAYQQTPPQAPVEAPPQSANPYANQQAVANPYEGKGMYDRPGTQTIQDPNSRAPRAMAGVTIMTGKGAQNRDFDTWQDKAYRVCCILMILFGAFDLFRALTPEKGGPVVYLAVLAGIGMIFGLCLLMEQAWAQFITKIYLYLNIAGILAGQIPMAVFLIALRPAIGVSYLLLSLFQLVYSGFFIYLIAQVGDM